MKQRARRFLVVASGGVVAGFVFLPTPLFAAPITIMPMGDSITVGVDYTGNSSGGYRSPLYTDLTDAGLSVQFQGATDTSPTATLNSTGNEYHNGYGSWHIQDLTDNLNGAEQPTGDNNEGGYFLTGTGTRPAEYPNLLLLEIGTNDFLQQQQTGIDGRIDTLLTTIHTLSPSTTVLIAGCIPINNDAGFNAEISTYDSYIENTLVPSLSYTRYVNLYADFLNPDGSTNSSLYGVDNIHPVEAGYMEMASTWASAIEQQEGVPEPSSFAFIGVATVAGVAVRRRRSVG
jgi:hypothetical protein